MKSTKSYKSLSEQFIDIGALRSKKEKIDALHEVASHHKQAILTIIDAAYNPNLKWRLPEGMPPLKPNTQPLDGYNQLYQAAKTFYIYFEGNANGLTNTQLEIKFIQLLEGLCKEDAEMIINMKDHRYLNKKLTAELMMEAFPECKNWWTKKV